MKRYDVVIIGAGIAGASIASEIGADRSVLLLEAEDHPGYHSTGRSAAFWTETYGGPRVQPLTSASRAFLDNPPPDFSPSGFLRPRGAVNIARDEQQGLADRFLDDFADSNLVMERWSREQARSLVPDLKPIWTETYGGPQVQPLTSASREFLDNPPPDFSPSGFLRPRGAVNIARDEQQGLADRFLDDFADSNLAMERWSREQARSLVPDLKPIWKHAIYEPDCCDIDVAGLHAAYLGDARRKAVKLVCRAPVTEILKRDHGWELSAGGESYHATVLVNAAGAWADSVARLAGAKPIGIQPLIRNMVQIETDPPSSPDMPLVVGLDGSFYFKPESGGSYWLSPHDEIPSEPGDVAADELSVAIAIDRFEKAVDVQVKRVSRKWAGLRSFAPDRLPVIGFDSATSDFFWFAGQGGFGIQTAPAAAKLARSVLLGQAPDESLRTIDASLYAASRFS